MSDYQYIVPKGTEIITVASPRYSYIVTNNSSDTIMIGDGNDFIYNGPTYNIMEIVKASEILGVELNTEMLRGYCEYIEKHHILITQESFKDFYKELKNAEFSNKIQKLIEDT